MQSPGDESEPFDPPLTALLSALAGMPLGVGNPVMMRLVLFIAVFSLPALAQDVSPLTFQAWKEQQILEAQNQTLRVSARISQLKSGKGAAPVKADSLPAMNSKVKKAADVDSLAVAEKELRRNQESLQTANALSLEDYVSVYLPTLQDQPEALQTLATKLSKDELAEIFKALVSRSSAPDAKRSGPTALTEALAPTPRSKSL